jgi:hypothetical protein
VPTYGRKITSYIAGRYEKKEAENVGEKSMPLQVIAHVATQSILNADAP